jgi:hypothetical protein
MGRRRRGVRRHVEQCLDVGGADSHGALPVPLVARLSIVVVPRQLITPGLTGKSPADRDYYRKYLTV